MTIQKSDPFDPLSSDFMYTAYGISAPFDLPCQTDVAGDAPKPPTTTYPESAFDPLEVTGTAGGSLALLVVGALAVYFLFLKG